MVTFSKMKSHYKTQYQLDTKLFTKDSRTEPVKQLYEQARDKHQLEVRSWMLCRLMVRVPVVSEE